MSALLRTWGLAVLCLLLCAAAADACPGCIAQAIRTRNPDLEPIAQILRYWAIGLVFLWDRSQRQESQSLLRWLLLTYLIWCLAGIWSLLLLPYLGLQARAARQWIGLNGAAGGFVLAALLMRPLATQSAPHHVQILAVAVVAVVLFVIWWIWGCRDRRHSVWHWSVLSVCLMLPWLIAEIGFVAHIRFQQAGQSLAGQAPWHAWPGDGVNAMAILAQGLHGLLWLPLALGLGLIVVSLHYRSGRMAVAHFVLMVIVCVLLLEPYQQTLLNMLP